MKMIIMMKSWRRLGVLLAVPALLLAAGCGDGAPAPSSTAKQSGQLSIVTAFYPFAFVAERVAGRHGALTSLTQPGAEPHDVELTPRQVGSLSSADLVVYERSFQPAVDQAVDQSGAVDVLDTATVVPLEPLGTPKEGHEGGELDPHVWLDPDNVARIATAVAQRLAARDPAHAADYEANARRLADELGALDAQFRSELASCDRSDFITTHAAFGYLARRYGLTQIGISGLTPDVEPSPARVAEVQREAAQHGVT